MDFQSLIDSQHPNSTLQLAPGEFFGQVHINKPMTIVGRGKSTWIGSRNGPTIRISAAGVRLRNLMIENTLSSQAVAIEAVPGASPVLENVVAKGLLVGVPPENVRDGVHEDGSPDLQISFLPPPPLSPSGANYPPYVPTEVTPVAREASPPVSSPPTYSPSPKGASAAAGPTRPAFGSAGWLFRRMRDPLIALPIGMCMVLGIVLVLLQHMRQQEITDFIKLERELRHEISRLRSDKQILEEQVAKLKYPMTQRPQPAVQRPVAPASAGRKPWTDYDTSHILREKTRWLPPFDR